MWKWMLDRKRFAGFAWGVLAYNVLVVLWGALVRATGAGAGCGNHWPLCNGQAVPVAPQIETVIEFTHRMMSGVSLIAVALLLVWGFRAFEKGHPVRFGVIGSVLFLLSEALVGAALVLFGWVAKDTSAMRPPVISVHLVNTFVLLAMLALTAWWASDGAPVRWQGREKLAWALGLALAGVIVIGVAGAVTALGDTLFPAESLAAGLQQDASASSNLLIRLRVFHPLIAIAVGVYLWTLVGLIASPEHSPAATTRTLARLKLAIRALVALQLAAGLVNVVLLAPIWMQLVHLLLADSVWIALVLFSAARLGRETRIAEREPVNRQNVLAANQ